MVKNPGSLDLVFQALGDPTRRAILERLSEGSATVSELAAPLPISLPAVHQHLQVLEMSGLVASQKNGRVRTCRLQEQSLGDADTWISVRRSLWGQCNEQQSGHLDDAGAHESTSGPADPAVLTIATPRPLRPRSRHA